MPKGCAQDLKHIRNGLVYRTLYRVHYHDCTPCVNSLPCPLVHPCRRLSLQPPSGRRCSHCGVCNEEAPCNPVLPAGGCTLQDRTRGHGIHRKQKRTKQLDAPCNKKQTYTHTRTHKKACERIPTNNTATHHAPRTTRHTGPDHTCIKLSHTPTPTSGQV